MNIFKKTIFALLISVLAMAGCKKEQSSNTELTRVQNKNFKSSVINNRLAFSTLEDYETLISDMCLKSDDDLIDLANSDSFTSMYEYYKTNNNLQNLPVDDIVLALLINPYGVIQIENFLFRIDLTNSTILAYQMVNNEQVDNQKISDLTSGIKTIGINEYSTADDVLDLLSGNFNPTDGDCPQEKLGYYYWNTSCGQVMYKTVYQKAGIYFSLQAKIKKDHWGGAEYLSISTNNSPSVGGTNFWKNKKKCDSFIKADQGYDREYNIRPYSGTRALTNYLFATNFSCSDNGVNYFQTLVLDCGNIQQKCN